MEGRELVEHLYALAALLGLDTDAAILGGSWGNALYSSFVG